MKCRPNQKFDHLVSSTTDYPYSPLSVTPRKDTQIGTDEKNPNKLKRGVFSEFQRLIGRSSRKKKKSIPISQDDTSDNNASIEQSKVSQVNIAKNNAQSKQTSSTIKGKSWKDVMFTDQSESEKGFYQDLQYNHGFSVRGKNYGMDRKKVDSGPALCRLILLELYEVEIDTTADTELLHLHRHDHISSQGAVKARLDALKAIEEPPFVFVMNFQIPGDPPISIVSMFAVPPELSEPITSKDSAEMQAHKRLWQAFINMPSSEEERLAQCLQAEREAEEEAANSYFSSWKAPSDITWGAKEEPGVFPLTDFKNQRFKLVPTVTEGNWLVRASVPSAKPALLGQKVQQRYFIGDNYIEVDVDVGSSVIAQRIVGMCRGYAKNFECSIAVILQGESVEELPERVLCGVKLVNIDVEQRRKLYLVASAKMPCTLGAPSVVASPPRQAEKTTKDVLLKDGDKSLVPKVGFSSKPFQVIGISWKDVMFTDQSESEKGFYQDLQYNHGFSVRGKNYGMDRKKVDSGPALCRLILLELYEVEIDTTADTELLHLHRHDHISSQGAVKARLDALKAIEEPPFVFVMNFQIPGDPPISIVSMFAVPPELSEPITSKDSAEMQAHKRLWQAFINMPSSEEERLAQCLQAEREAEEEAANSYFSSWKAPSDITWGAKEEPGVFPLTDFKNQRFKLVPTVTEGNWLVRASVPSAKPALLGQKVQQRYFMGDNYIEVDVDVGSSVIAQRIVGMCRGYAKNFECSIAVILQGESVEELPERVLCGVKLVNIDVEQRRRLHDGFSEDNAYIVGPTSPTQSCDCDDQDVQARHRTRSLSLSTSEIEYNLTNVSYVVTGSSWKDVMFTDQSESEKGFYQDLQYNHGFSVRGKNYGMDRKKVDSGPALCRLILLELYEVEIDTTADTELLHLHRHDHISSQGAVKARLDALKAIEEPPFVFVMNFQIPGDPPISIVSMFAVPPELSEPITAKDSAEMQAHKRLWQAFVNMPSSEEERLAQCLQAEREAEEEAANSYFSSWKAPSDITWGAKEEPGVFPLTDFKNQRFKLVPTVTEGNWLVRASVPSAKPALLGQKVQQRYFMGDNYIEVDVDVGSSVIAQRIVGMCRGYAKNFECSIAVILQGESVEELPERVLCGVKLVNIDVEQRRKLYLGTSAKMPCTLGAPSVVASPPRQVEKTTKDVLLKDGDKSLVPKAGFSSKPFQVIGNSWKDVMFTDQSESEKGFYQDLQYNHGFSVRGKNYGMDRKKVDSGPALCRLILLELYEVEIDTTADTELLHLHRHDHISSQGAVKARLDALKAIEEPPFVFVMNFQIPGDPPISIVSMFAVPPELSEPITSKDSAEMQAHKRLWQAFINMPSSEEERLAQCLQAEREAEEEAASSYFSSWKAPSDITWGAKEEPGVFPLTDFKNQRFKLVPTVTEGNWLVRASVPSAKPALLGQKVQQRYFMGDNYIEVDVDVGSSVIAQRIVGMCRGYAKNFECSIAVILQGESVEELPERVLCGVKLVNIDVEQRRRLYGRGCN